MSIETDIERICSELDKTDWSQYSAVEAGYLAGRDSVKRSGIAVGDPAFRKTAWDLKALMMLPMDERNKILEDAAEKGASLYAWAKGVPQCQE